MLPFFPEPYSDELAYSIFARYHYLSCNTNFKETMKDLFGSTTACAVVDLPNRLQRLCDQLPKNSSITAESIIQKNTLFPLFQPFLPQHRTLKIIQMMKDSNKGSRIHNTCGVMASTIPAPKHLRVCPQCLTEDEESFGETYWHRIHQVFGVFICPHHQVWLKESNISISSPMNKHVFNLIIPNKIDKTIQLENCEDGFNLFEKIAELVYWFLDNTIFPPGLVTLRKHYISFLQNRELATPTGRVRQHDLIEEFTAFFGRVFLQSLKSEVNYSPDNWLSKLLREPRTTTHPIRHILLMIFLGASPEEILSNDKMNFSPFGSGPWPCLNPVSGHYRKLIIKKIEITQDSKLKCPVGHFTCKCGFGYSRRGSDQSKTDSYIIGKIQSFGPVWQAELLRLVASKDISFREMARRLNVDSKTIKKQLSLIKVKNTIIKNSKKMALNRDSHREHWNNVKIQNPGKSRTELRKLAYGIYAWLYRNDREWLIANLPKPLKKRRCDFSRVDWNERDQYLVDQVFKAVKKIKESEQFGKTRLSLSSIGKEIGELMVLQKHLDKLPKTREALKIVSETKEKFRIRRANIAISQITERGEALQPWKIAREACIRPEFMAPVIQALNLNIIEEGDFNELFI